MTDEAYRKRLLAEAKTKYPFFVRDEMTVKEYLDELQYYMVHIAVWRGGKNGYQSLYEQGKDLHSAKEPETQYIV